MLAATTHILPLTHIRRARLLPSAGSVLVKVGQSVTAVDVIAEAPQSQRHVFINLRNALRPPAGSNLLKLLVREPGENVQAGDVIAETRGLFQRVLRAPSDCKIIGISGESLLLEMPGDLFQLQAGFNGQVVEIIPERGAILENDGLLIQGVWGNGHTGLGILHVMANAPGEAFTASQVDPTLRGAVVFAACCNEESALQAAEEAALHGLILGSMPSDLIPFAQSLSVPIMLLEGFGSIPVNSKAFRLLSSSAEQEVSVHAVPWNAANGERPELFIPLPASGETASEVAEFAAGQTVRILGSPYAGQIATIEDVLPGSIQLANGLRAPSASLLLENRQEVIVPLNNLDVLE